MVFYVELGLTALIWIVALFIRYRVSRSDDKSMRTFFSKMKWLESDGSLSPNFSKIKRLRLILSIYTLACIALAPFIALMALKVGVFGEYESRELMLYAAGLIGLAGVYLGALWFVIHTLEHKLSA